MKAQITALEKELQKLENRRNEVTTQRDTLRAQESEAKAALADGTGEISTLTVLSGQIAALGEVLTTIQGNIDDVTNNLSDYRTKVARENHRAALVGPAIEASQHLQEFIEAREHAGAAILAAMLKMEKHVNGIAAAREDFAKTLRNGPLSDSQPSEILTSLERSLVPIEGIETLFFQGIVPSLPETEFSRKPLLLPELPGSEYAWLCFMKRQAELATKAQEESVQRHRNRLPSVQRGENAAAAAGFMDSVYYDHSNALTGMLEVK